MKRTLLAVCIGSLALTGATFAEKTQTDQATTGGNKERPESWNPPHITRVIHAFCRDLSLCSRGHLVFHEDKGFNVLCYSTRGMPTSDRATPWSQLLRS